MALYPKVDLYLIRREVPDYIAWQILLLLLSLLSSSFVSYWQLLSVCCCYFLPTNIMKFLLIIRDYTFYYWNWEYWVLNIVKIDSIYRYDHLTSFIICLLHNWVLLIFLLPYLWQIISSKLFCLAQFYWPSSSIVYVALLFIW